MTEEYGEDEYRELTDEEFEERMMEWMTFYRRNPHRFVEHYLNIKLYPYQKIWIYLMRKYPQSTIVATRGSAKSFLIGLYACVECMLRPGFKVVIVSASMDQSKLIITEKIKELREQSQNLNIAIEKVEEGRAPKVTFTNGSTIKVVVGSQNARGNRANMVIYEEFRMIEENLPGEVVRPMLKPRDMKFQKLPEFKKYKSIDFGERSKSIYISSAWYKSNWMWNHMKRETANMFNNPGSSIILSFDYAITLKHDLKEEDVLRAAKAENSLAFATEYENLMLGVSGDAFFNYDMIRKNQNIQECSYPRKHEWAYKNKQPQNKDTPVFKTPKKKEGEIRVLAADIAVAGGSKNDNSVFTIVNAIPPKARKDDAKNERLKWYTRNLMYIETHNGATADYQAIRLKQLFDDFNCDYIVLDGKTVGLTVFDKLHYSETDGERDIKQKAFSSMNMPEENERSSNACEFEEVVFIYKGDSALNTKMHLNMYTLLDQRRLNLLIDRQEAEAFIKETVGSKNYINIDFEEREKLLLPYSETTLLVHEMINLAKDTKKDDGNNIKLVEPSTGTKDRYISIAMANYFISEIKEKELQSYDNEADWDDMPMLVSSVNWKI